MLPPVPPIQNSLAVTNFQPKNRVIFSISNSFPAIVNTTVDHEYNSGVIIKFLIPQASGMQQLNNQFAPITVISPNQFTVPIDTTFYTPFVGIPTLSSKMPPQANPIAELNTKLNSAEDNVPPLALQ